MHCHGSRVEKTSLEDNEIEEPNAKVVVATVRITNLPPKRSMSYFSFKYRHSEILPDNSAESAEVILFTAGTL